MAIALVSIAPSRSTVGSPSLAPMSADGRATPSDVALDALRWYKKNLSPLLPPGCRFVPTCSEYAMHAFEQYPPAQAALLTAWRIVRCNPTAGYGADPPRWPPVNYFAGDKTKPRTPLDDEMSRRRALGEDVDVTFSPRRANVDLPPPAWDLGPSDAAQAREHDEAP